MPTWALIVILQGEPPVLMAAIPNGAECDRMKREFLDFKKRQGKPAEAGCYLLIEQPTEKAKS